MASGCFKQAFDFFKDFKQVKESLKSVVVKVIELDNDKKKLWQEGEFWQGLVAENISISFLSSPCVLEARAPNSAEQYHLLHGEVRHVFTPAFWPKVLSEPVCGAIIISHLRALNEGLHHLNKREGIIIILEGDIEARNNSLGLFLHFLAQILGNPHLQHTLYTALTFSEWHPGHAKKVHEEARHPIPGTRRGPYFSMCSLPVQSMRSDKFHFRSY